MVSRLVVLGKEIRLPVDVSESELTKDSVLSLLRDLDPELSKELEGTEYTIRIEGDTAVVYRTGATFG